jgi:hypothetical protein
LPARIDEQTSSEIEGVNEMNAPKMAPILEIDEYETDDHDSWRRTRWSADGETTEVSLGSWPTDLDS